VVVVFDAELWIWDARRADSWTFVSLPVEASEEIREAASRPPRGFGALRVRVTVGGSTWTTSIFPDSARGCYVLPIKRAVRKAEALDVGDIATVTVELVNPLTLAPARISTDQRQVRAWPASHLPLPGTGSPGWRRG
jgi:hypothetical protein